MPRPVGIIAGLLAVGLVAGAAVAWSRSEQSHRTPPTSASAAPSAASSVAPTISPTAASSIARAVAPSTAPSTAPTTARSEAALPVAPCAESAITAALLPDTPARGHVPYKGISGATVLFTNVGTTPCRLRGYPGIGFYAEGSEVSLRSGPGLITVGGPAPTTVALAPGASGYSEIRWFETGETTRVEQVGLIAPGRRRQTLVRAGWDVDAGNAVIDVGPLTTTLDPAPGPAPAS